MATKKNQLQRQRRHQRVRGKIFGTRQKPRLNVFRSSKYIYAQIIDDTKGQTLVAHSDLTYAPNLRKQTKTQIARRAGRELAKKALAQGFKKVVFDRGGYKYHGRVKALADGAREGGLEF